MPSPLIEFIAREHPALVHVPLGLVMILPLALGISYGVKDPHPWIRKAMFLAALAWLGSLLSLFTGLLWARQINLVPNGAYLPTLTSGAQVLQAVLWRHEILAAVGAGLGLICLLLLWKALSDPRQRLGALAVALAWAGTWGLTGRLGGTMVFGNEATNRASAEADAARRKDLEADLPIRALDYASLEPLLPVPFRSPAHGGHWSQTWVTASGADALQAGQPLPVGAYAVRNTFLDLKGKPGHEPGPLYSRETRADGSQAFALYWPRVPDAHRAATGGQDSVYWRSPAPQLNACASCHPSTPKP